MLVFKVTTGITIVSFFIFFVLILVILNHFHYNLRNSLSEPLRGKDNELVRDDTTKEIIYVESSSRLIALVGLSAILAMDLGVTVMIFYSTLVQTTINLDLKTIGAFLIAQAGIFAPYIANQIQSAVVGAKTVESTEKTVDQSNPNPNQNQAQKVL